MYSNGPVKLALDTTIVLLRLMILKRGSYVFNS